MFWGQICFPSSGLLLPKQISLHGGYLHCNALWLTSDGYSNQDISHALYARNKQWNKIEESTGIAMLPYHHAASNKISRLLAKCDLKTHHHQWRTSLKEKQGWKPLMYGVCQPSRSLETRCKEHARHLFLGQPENSAVTEYCGYRTAWNSTAFTEWLRWKGVWIAWLRRLLGYNCVPWTSTEFVDSCLAEPGSSCCNTFGIHPMRNEIRTQQYFTPFPWLWRTVITINFPTTRTVYTVLLFIEVK